MDSVFGDDLFMTHCPEKIGILTGNFDLFRYRQESSPYCFTFRLDNDLYEIIFPVGQSSGGYPRVSFIDQNGDSISLESFSNLNEKYQIKSFLIYDPLKDDPEYITNDEYETLKRKIYRKYDEDILDTSQYKNKLAPFRCYFCFYLEDNRYFAIEISNHHHGETPNMVNMYKNGILFFNTFV